MARIRDSEIERQKNEVSVERLIDLGVKSQYCSLNRNKLNTINVLNRKNTPSSALSELYRD